MPKSRKKSQSRKSTVTKTVLDPLIVEYLKENRIPIHKVEVIDPKTVIVR